MIRSMRSSFQAVFLRRLLAPTTKTGLMAAIAGDEVAGGGATAHPTVILA
jgi:hypothetical protein